VSVISFGVVCLLFVPFVVQCGHGHGGVCQCAWFLVGLSNCKFFEGALKDITKAEVYVEELTYNKVKNDVLKAVEQFRSNHGIISVRLYTGTVPKGFS
jgi:hypothetical protein